MVYFHMVPLRARSVIFSRVPPTIRKMIENFRELLDKISRRAISPVILSVNCTVTPTVLTYFMTRLSQCSH